MKKYIHYATYVIPLTVLRVIPSPKRFSSYYRASYYPPPHQQSKPYYTTINMCELGERLELYSHLFCWRIKMRVQYDTHIIHDTDSFQYVFETIDARAQEVVNSIESDKCQEVVDAVETQLPDNGTFDMSVHIDYELEERSFSMDNWFETTTKETWKQLILDLMSDLEYLINRGRYARTKCAPPTV